MGRFETVITLEDVVERDLGAPPRQVRQPFWHCPFHDDRTPSFTLMPDKQRWKCFGCDRSGDAIDYLRERHGFSFGEALAYLGRSSESPVIRTRRPRRRKPPRELSELQISFARHASDIVHDCIERLHSPQGARAFQWLRLRGLKPEIIRLAKLGYNPGIRYPSGSWVGHGITIPWMDGERVQAIKVRHARKTSKYTWVKGQNRSGLYFLQPIKIGRPTVITEGEFDAILGYQELGDVVNVGTLGSASASPDDRSVQQLLGSPIILLCYDPDEAGHKATSRWQTLTNRARVISMPPERDLTDLYRDCGDLHGCLEECLHYKQYNTTRHPTVGVKPMTDKEKSVGMGTRQLPDTSSS